MITGKVFMAIKVKRTLSISNLIGSPDGKRFFFAFYL